MERSDREEGREGASGLRHLKPTGEGLAGGRARARAGGYSTQYGRRGPLLLPLRSRLLLSRLLRRRRRRPRRPVPSPWSPVPLGRAKEPAAPRAAMSGGATPARGRRRAAP